jgi:4-diphosphocytidyl-2-C-methyl-D-erythritol kinase
MPLAEQALAKINLTLRVLGRRADGYHTLESLVAFADFGDRLTLEPGREASLMVSGPFANASGAIADNLVLKAAAALASRIPGVRVGRFLLEKNIPVAAGLGGGSSDAAAALRLLAVANEMTAADPSLYAAARDTGADVAICLDMRTRVMRGIGDELSRSLVLPKLHALLVNPGVALATRDVFAKLDLRQVGGHEAGNAPHDYEAFIAWLAAQGNDLTEPACRLAPAIREVLAALSSQSGCRLARMSGSGATCFGLFDSASEAENAGQTLRAAQPKWWVKPVLL